MDDLELTELLFLAEDDHRPPTGFEARLLEELKQVLEESSRPTRDTGESVLRDIDVDRTGVLEAGTEAEFITLLEPEPRTRRSGGHRLLLLGAAAALLVVAAISLTLRPDDTAMEVRSGVEPQTDIPTSPPPTAPVLPAVTTLSNEELCTEMDTLILNSGFVGAERAQLDGVQLARGADLIEEIDQRFVLGSDVTDAVARLRYAALTSAESAPDAEDAHDRARAATIALRLERLTCPPH